MWAAITWGNHFLTYPGLDLADPLIVEYASYGRQDFVDALVPVAYAALIDPSKSRRSSEGG
jgi:hypothetical protein